MPDTNITEFDVSRRRFLTGAGGLTFAVALGTGTVTLLNTAHARARDLSVWVRIAPDNAVTIITPAAEMGQGSMTGVPMALAEELDADWDKVTLEMAPADPKIYGYSHTRRGKTRKRMMIVGSRAVMMYYTQMRLAGAQVRKVLIANAAKHWGVDAAELTTEPSKVVHKKSGKRLTYGEIASFATMPAKLPDVSQRELKSPRNFRIIGKSLPRRDIPEKVDGSAIYSMDIQLPGMVYATTVHGPVQQSRPQSWNDADVKKRPGVITTVKLKHGIAIVADSVENVLSAREALKASWKKARAEGFNSEQELDTEYAKYATDKNADSTELYSRGDDKAAFKDAANTYKADYKSDIGYHAQMEPLNAVARFNASGDKVEIWEGTQAPGGSRAKIAKALGFSTKQVIHHQCYLGGGFGRRSITDYTVEAALVARAIRKPVKMIWTREEDLSYGMFRPQSLQCMEAALDQSGKITGWRHCVIGDGKRLLQSGVKIPYYKIPNQNIERRDVGGHGVRLKHWRAVGHVFNIFAIEAFIDEMAVAENMDPFDFRYQRIGVSDKAHTVFETLKHMSDWNAKRPAGRALGMAMGNRSGSLGAGVAEISLNRETGVIRVHKLWIAVDAGTVVLPDAAKANVESGMIYGLSSVLKERVTVKKGIVEQSNFHDYELLRMSETPEELHVEFVKTNRKPTGIGEVGNPMIAAAVANAFFKLTGKRLYHMPFTPERVKAALKA
ncbi:MAG: molybdopterin cofactor-binding domain-containing protein [Rhodospirillales bacterium]